MKSLQFADLSDNGFMGTIPTEIGQLNDLVTLDVSGNTLTGSLPTEFSEISTLTQFAFSFNDLTGSVSKTLCVDSKQWEILQGDCLDDGYGQSEIECICCTSCCNANGTQCI